MIINYRIAAYTRISVDTELDKDNTSIENQKAIIEDYCKIHFPTSTVDYYEDRDHSGYTFEQRPDYWLRLRPKLLRGEYDILIVKDLSRFSRRTGKGLAEFEDLAEHDVRIIAIGDGVDYYQDHTDDWMKIKLYFFVNEMPVTDASRKVSDVIASRQAKGEWICSVPYGYVITNSKKMTFEVDEAAAEVVRTIFKLYIEGYGYKRIANYLTDQSIPTPRMREKARKEAAGDEYKGKVREQWSIVTVSEILCNDFYIGTLRERKFRRKKINGADVALDESEHIVFENHHEPIVDYRVFATAQEMLKQRSTNHYRGVKKYDNTYSGFMFCGDCGSPMFAMSRKDLAEAYTCGTYHVRGLAGCTSHHVRADFLDKMLKQYVKRVRDNSAAMLRILEEMLSHEQRATDSGMFAADELRAQIEAEREELKLLARQKIRDMARHKDNAQVMEETYDALIEEANNRIEGLTNQLALVADTTNTIVKVNRVSRSVIEIFDDIIEKEKLDKHTLHLIIDRIIIYEDNIEIKLQADVDELLHTGTIEHMKHNEESEVPVNFNSDTENIEKATEDYSIVAAQRARNQRDKVFRVNVISGGDPLEIYTDREGEVIFKKYSPIGELNSFATQYAETLHKTGEISVLICDRDAVIAVSGAPKKEYVDKHIAPELEVIIESRQLYLYRDGETKFEPINDNCSHYIRCAMPIISEGDILGCVVSLDSLESPAPRMPEHEKSVEVKLVQTAAAFLGKQLES
ncbi:MAG: recombinase family protein [Clostridia bacterium]|nr:recombinase family protein [Clostridia bacterium]